MYRQQSLAWQAAIEEFLSHVSHLAEPSSSCGSLFVLSKFRNSRFLALWYIELERIQTASASMRAQSIPRCRLRAGIRRKKTLLSFLPTCGLLIQMTVEVRMRINIQHFQRTRVNFSMRKTDSAMRSMLPVVPSPSSAFRRVLSSAAARPFHCSGA